MISCTGSARRILRDLKKSVSWVESCLERRQLSFVCSRRPCDGCHTCWVGGRWKSLNRKNVYLSPYIEEPLNSKVIKSFVSELRSRKCFSCFEIPMFYLYMLWTFYVRFTHSPIMATVQRELSIIARACLSSHTKHYLTKKIHTYKRIFLTHIGNKSNQDGNKSNSTKLRQLKMQ